jgi:hypothetical protein
VVVDVLKAVQCWRNPRKGKATVIMVQISDVGPASSSSGATHMPKQFQRLARLEQYTFSL